MQAISSLFGVLTVTLLMIGCGGDDGLSPNPATGFEGTWVGEVKGSVMTLEIEDFWAGVSAEGTWSWEDLRAQRLTCRNQNGELTCKVWYAAPVDSCFIDGGLSLDVLSASSSSIRAEVGGEVGS